MKALGMIEVRGMVPAVEALDSALKAANVTRLDVVKTGGGLVSTLIEGEVGAVQAAIDAAQAAAERLGTVISVHVIPRPADEVARMLKKDPENPEKTEPPKKEPDSQPESEKAEAEPEQKDPAEALREPEPSETPEESCEELSREKMQEMTVDHLRSLARQLEITNMTRKEIRYSNKEELIRRICEFLNKENN